MSEHTPGPWEYCAIKTDQYDKHCGPYGAHEDCVKIGERLLKISCFAYPGSFAGAEEVWEANARLIAAAPEMLEALEEITDAFTDAMQYHGIPLNRHEADAVVRAEYAIKKARGEE